MSEEVLIRPYQPADLGLIINQWLGRDWRDSKYSGVVPNDQFKRVYAECIRQLLARGATIGVACNPSKPEHLLGWACYEHTPRDRILHFVYVRSLFRGQGLGRALLTEVGFPRGVAYVYTFRTRDSDRFLTGGRHLPALARRRDAYKEDSAPAGDVGLRN